MSLVHRILLLACLCDLATSSFFGEAPGSNQACTTDSDCPLINCFLPPCPDAVCIDGLCQVEPDPPNPECIRDSECPPLQVCNAGICELESAQEDTFEESEANESNGITGAHNSTIACGTDADCPRLECQLAPCDRYICNATIAECVKVEMDVACGHNHTPSCDEFPWLLNVSVTMDFSKAGEASGKETPDTHDETGAGGGTDEQGSLIQESEGLGGGSSFESKCNPQLVPPYSLFWLSATVFLFL